MRARTKSAGTLPTQLLRPKPMPYSGVSCEKYSRPSLETSVRNPKPHLSIVPSAQVVDIRTRLRISPRETLHLRNMRRLDEEDCRVLERMAAKWAAERREGSTSS